MKNECAASYRSRPTQGIQKIRLYKFKGTTLGTRGKDFAKTISLLDPSGLERSHGHGSQQPEERQRTMNQHILKHL